VSEKGSSPEVPSLFQIAFSILDDQSTVVNSIYTFTQIVQSASAEYAVAVLWRRGCRLLLFHDGYRQYIGTGVCADNGADIR
jgi:hypothetical protein